MEKKEEKIGEALLKVALGYQLAEVTEEYAETDGALKLVKRKKTKKDVPPDLKAVQMLLSGENGEGYADWTDEQLEAEKARLLEKLMKESEKAVAKKVVKKTKAGGRVATKTKSKRTVAAKKTAKKSVKKSVETAKDGEEKNG